MICPKCAKASIVEIVIKTSGKNAFLCDHCDTVWLAGEVLTAHSGRPFEQVTKQFTIRKQKRIQKWIKKHNFFRHVFAHSQH